MNTKIPIPHRGRILKIKTGFNPNSSSISTDIVTFFTCVAGISTVFAGIASIIFSRFKNSEDQKRKVSDESKENT